MTASPGQTDLIDDIRGGLERHGWQAECGEGWRWVDHTYQNDDATLRIRYLPNVDPTSTSWTRRVRSPPNAPLPPAQIALAWLLGKPPLRYPAVHRAGGRALAPCVLAAP